MVKFPLLTFVVLLSGTFAARADNVVHPGAPVQDRPTLMAIGVQLPISGDDNFNATVTLRYRQSGTSAWRNGLPLYRVQPASIFGWTAAPQFAGSIFDLRPQTTYDVELHILDPDGPVDQVIAMTAVTRAVPGDPVNPRIRNVADVPSLVGTLATAQPGDVIVLANGVYAGNFGMNASGTAANPIVIRGASQDGVILDGSGCTGCNVLELYGSFVHVEQLTIRNAERAIRFQTSGSQGIVVRRLHITDVTMGIGGRSPQYDHYISDNILEGRLGWPLIYTDDGGAHSDDTGITVSGSGMVVAHNRLSGFGDALRTQSAGARSVDFYGNEVLWSYDNGVELDESEGNARAIRNRFTNTNAAISVQPIYAGPAYILRNVVLNTVDEQIKFHAEGSSQPNGVFVYHNTFVSPSNEIQVQTPNASHHLTFKNNLFIAPPTLLNYAINWDAPIDDGTFDYNGYFPDGRFLFLWANRGYTNFANFAAMQSGGVEPHGRLLGGQIFANGLTAPTSYLNRLSPQDVTPAGGGPAIDKGQLLPGLNDSYTGAAPDLGAAELGCSAPIYGPRAPGVDESNEPLGCETAPVVAPSATAQFVKVDTTTQGNWRSAYGADGYSVVGDGSVNPSYGQTSVSGQSLYQWTASTSDVRALQKASNPNDRVVAVWYSAGSFVVDVNLLDGATHQAALYAMDWDGYQGGRSERIDVLDANSGAVLDSRTVSSFTAGQYLVWNVRNHVQFRVTNLNAGNALIEGIFFGGALAAPSPSSSAQFLKVDTATQGNWRSAYGADGYGIAGDSSANPAYGQVSLSGQLFFQWATSTSDVRALQKSANSSDRIVATWYSGSSFVIDVNLTDGGTHQVAAYVMDWDGYGGGRSERVDVIDAGTGTLLDTRSISSFASGQYLVWNVKGHVQIRVTNLNSANALIEGIFFGGSSAPAVSSAAQFLKVDTATQGNWRSAYGADGYSIAGDSAANPAYGQASLAGQLFYQWTASTTDVRGLQKATNPNDRIAAAWYSGGTFTIDVNLTDGGTHQLAAYATDWDGYLGGRSERIDVVDAATGTLLDSRSVFSFGSGQYLVWNVRGHVQLRVTNLTLGNALVQGIFFGGAVALPTGTGNSAQFLKVDTATQGNWRGIYGVDGYRIAGDSSINPAYGTASLSGQLFYQWTGSTTDPRALQKATNPSDRLAAVWYSAGSFASDVALTDGGTHKVAVYAMDWDGYLGGRSQRIDVIDASSGALLDSRSVSSFANGQYLVWNVKGHVIIQITNLTAGNALIEGIFFGGQ